MNPIDTILDVMTDVFLAERDLTNGSFIYPCDFQEQLQSTNPEWRSLFSPILDICKSRREEKEFSISYREYTFRVTLIVTPSGPVFALRKAPSECWSLDDCGFKGYIYEFLASKYLIPGGIILVAGTPGDGKSTTCAAIIKERLQIHGGFCLTIEDPIEMPLNGFHNKGVCLQRAITGQETFAGAISEALRSYPSKAAAAMLLIGEIRDEHTASLALKASIDGRLVIASMHAGSTGQAIRRFMTLAGEKMGTEVNEIFANSLRCVIHQKLEVNGMVAKPLYCTKEVKGIINKGDHLITLIEAETLRQEKQLMWGTSKAIEHHPPRV